MPCEYQLVILAEPTEIKTKVKKRFSSVQLGGLLPPGQLTLIVYQQMAKGMCS